MDNDRLSAAEMADILHQASSIYLSANLPRDYGTGELYTAVEVHMLKYIVDHPGKTLTELSYDWDKTKASLSQMLKKLESKGLIYHSSAPDSMRKQLYYTTPEGTLLNSAHEEYDNKTFGVTLDTVRKTCTEEEISCCFKVLRSYAEAQRQKHYRSDK